MNEIKKDISFFEFYQSYLYEKYNYTMDKLNATTLFWHYDKLTDIKKFRETGYHSYHLSYSKHLHKIKNSVKKVLEIGVFKGHSMLLWNNYFPNADIYGIDIKFDKLNFGKSAKDICKNNNKIKLKEIDAYKTDTIKTIKKEWGTDFDIIIDDGSHHPSHQLFFILHYKDLLASNGIMIVEDVFMKNSFDKSFLDYYDIDYRAFKDKKFFFDEILQTKTLNAHNFDLKNKKSINLNDFNITIEKPVDYELEFKNINLKRESIKETYNNRQGIIFFKKKK